MAKQFNFINEKGVGDNQLPLTVSTTDEKVDKSVKTAQDIIKEVTLGIDFSNGNPEGLAGIIGSQSVKDAKMTKAEAEKYLKYGVMPSGYVEPDVLDRSRAKNQSAIEQFGRMLGQATVNEVILGTVRGFSDIFDSAINALKGFTFDDYSNPVSKELEDLQNQVRENWAIYQEENDGGFHMGDFGWWMNGTVSAATTLSLMLPGLGITKGVSLLGKIPLKRITLGGKIDRIGIKATQAITGGKGARLYKTIKDGTEVGGMALLSRTAENYQEAREVYNAVLEKSKLELANMSESDRKEFLERNPQYANMNDDDIAANIATITAGETFRNDYWMLLMDIPQFKGLKSIWKGAGAGRMGSVATTRTVRKANKEILDKLTKGSLSEEAAAAASKKFSKDAFTNAFRLENIGKNAKDFFTRTEGLSLGEAVEEGFQGIQSEKGKEVGEMYFNPTLVQKTLGDYLRDETIWEQAFWGVFGGLLFQAGSKGFRRLEDNLRAKIKTDKLTNNEIKALKAGQDKARVEEIYGRFAKMDDYKRKMQLVNNGFNPYSPIRKKDGTVETNNAGDVVYNPLDGKLDSERIKTQLTHDFITDLTLDAVDTGNYDLLKEFVSQKEFSKYFEEAGLENDNLFESQLISEMDEIAKEYQRTYYDVISNADAYNDYITRSVARSILKRKEYLKAINDRQEQIDSQLSEEGIDDIDLYYKQALKLAITQKIAAYQKAINELEERKKDRDDFLSNQAYNYQLKDYANQLNRLYDELQNIDDRFVKIGQIENISSQENLQDILKEAEAIYNDFLIDFGIIKNVTESISKLNERTQQLLYQKSIYELEKIQNEMYLPNTNNAKEYYQNEYDNQEAMYVELAKSKFGRAWDVINNFVEKSENPYETVQHLLKDDISEDNTLNKFERRRLEDALEVLRFGSKDREFFNQTLAFMVNQLEAKRRKESEEREKVNISGEEVNPQQEETDNNVSSTGETQEAPKSKVTPVTLNAVVSEGPEYIPDDELPFPVEGEVEQFVPDANEVEIPELTKAEQAILNDYGRINIVDTNKAEEATIRNIRQNRSIYEQLLKDGIDSEAGTTLLNIIRDDLIAQGLEPTDARQFALSGLRTYLQIEYQKSHFNEKTPAAKILLQLAKLKGYKEGDRNSLYADEEISEQSKLLTKAETLEELFEIFSNDLVKTEVNGKPVIDLKDLFVKISKILDDNQYTYEQLLSLYKDINQYINNRQADLQNSPYIFVNKNFLNRSQAEFIKALYDKKTERTPINPFKHFKSTLESDLNETFDQLHPNTNVEEFLVELTKYARDKKVTFKRDKNVIQLLITYDGNNKKFAKEKGKTFELGIISVVKKNKDNTKLTSQYNGVDITVELNKDGSVKTSFDEILNECLNNDNLYETLKHHYIYANPYNFTKRVEEGERGEQFDESREYKLKKVPSDKIKEFLNNKIIKDFAIEQGIFQGENEDDEHYFVKIANKITPILFYQFNTKRQSSDDNFAQIMSKQGIAESLDKYRRKVYEDFIQTDKIQTMLVGKQEIEASLKSDNVGKITFGGEFFINGRGFGGKQALSHPFVELDMTECIDENGKKYLPIANAENTLRGVGIVIGENQGFYESDDTTLTQKSGVNVAFIVGGTNLSENNDGRAKKERSAFRNATKNYLNKLFNDYLLKVKDKSLPFTERNKAFDDLYDNIVALFGRNEKLLTGIYAKKSGDTISILRTIDSIDENGKPVTSFETIAIVYKYSGVKYDKNKRTYTVNGKPITGEDLQERFEGNIQLGNPKSNNKVVISKISKTNTENISKFVDYIIDNSEFNTTRFAIQNANKQNVDGKHIAKRNGKIVIKVGDYEKEFVNFTDAAVSLNMFITTEPSNRRQNSYNYEDENGEIVLPTSFYVDIKGVTRPVDEQQNIVDKGLAYWKQANDIKDRTEVPTEEIITYSGLNDREKEALRELNSALNNQLFTDTIVFGGNENFKTVDEEGNEIIKESSGRYIKSTGKIILTNRGIQSVTNKPASLIRLLVHENIHRIVDQQGVLKGKIGQQRITEIKDIFNQFWNALQKAHDSREKEYLVNKFTAFQQDYGNRDVVFVDEFIAEALTDITLRDFLNKVQSKETVIVEKDQTKKTLLQRLLEKIVEIFSSITNVNNNTLLAQLNRALGEQQELNLFNQQKEEVVETVETSQTPVEESVVLTPEEQNDEDVEVNEPEIKDNGTDIKLSDDDFDFSLYDVIDENEIKSNSFNENREVNPFGVMTASDMNSFLMQIPSDQRAAMASAVANGEFNYQCQ